MNAVEIDRLTVVYAATRVLDDLSLTVAPGEVLGLVGESGSGKSTLALALAGLLPREAGVSGVIRFASRQGGRPDVGIVFQEPMAALNPLMRVGAQVAETFRIDGLGRAEAAARARALLAEVGIRSPSAGPGRYPHQLSGGQRQRVLIAIATARAPTLLIADEPTTALDPLAQAEVLRLLVARARGDGAALLLVTHDLAVVAGIADRIAVLDRGRIVEAGPIGLLRAPAHPTTHALVAAFTLPAPVPPPPIGAPILEARALTRDHPRPRAHPFDRPTPIRALDGVSLTLARGERVGIVGASGAGKSTLLRLLLALDRPTSGTVHLGGQPFGLDAPPALRRLIQPVFQDPLGSFDPCWAVHRIVAEPLHLAPLPPLERTQRIAAALARVDLAPDIADRLPRQLSGGQRQRVAIARALIVQPAIIALDEAVSALDPRVRATVLALLDRLSRDLGLAIVLVSHDLQVIAQATDRLIVLDQGRIVEQGPTSAILAAPAHPATRALVDDTPSLARALATRDAIDA